MTGSGGTYTWTSPYTPTSNTSVEFKVVDNGNWKPNDNIGVTIFAGNTLTVKYVSSSSTITPYAGLVVTGQPTSVFGGSSTWDNTNAAGLMTDNGDGTYTWTSPTVSSTESYEFKVVSGANWSYAWPSSNYSGTIQAGNSITVTFNRNTDAVTVTENSPTPIVDYYAIIGSPSSLFGNEWDVTSKSAEMTDNGDDTYTWTSSTMSSSTDYEFKVVKNGSYSTAWPSDNIVGTVLSGNTLTVTYDSRDDSVIATTPEVYNISGSSTELFGASWDPSNSATLMTSNGDGTYTWTSSVVASSTSAVEFKVLTNYSYKKSWPSSNYSIQVPAGHLLTVTVNPTTGTVTASTSEPPHTYTVAGDNTTLFGSSTWDATNTANDMTDNGNGTYTWTKATTLSASAEVKFKVCQDHAWTNSWPSDDYSLILPKGHTLSITYNSSTHAVSHTTSGPDVFSVVGSSTDLFGGSAAWDASNLTTEMTLSSGSTYTWTSPEATSTQNVEFKVYTNFNNTATYPASNYQITVPKHSILTVTYNSQTNEVTATVSNPHTYTVTTDNTQLTGSPTWDATRVANDMTASNGTYTWTSTAISASSYVQYRVAEDHALTNCYPITETPIAEHHPGIIVPKGHTLTLTYDPNDDSVTASTSGPDVFSVAGSSTSLFGYEWSAPNLATEMTLSSGTTYTWTSPVATATEIVEFQVVTNFSWDNTAYPGTNYRIMVPKGQALTVTYDSSDHTVNAEITGSRTMYVIGQVKGNPWAANVGVPMEASADGTVYTLNNVQIVKDATFAFSPILASTDTDWTTLQPARITSAADGDVWIVTDAMTDKNSPQALNILPWVNADKGFQISESASYNITIDLKAVTVTIARRYGSLYMFHGDHWTPSTGENMISSDGNVYSLSNVSLDDNSTFQFSTQLGDSWSAIASYRIGANAEGSNWLVTEALLGIEIENALLEGGTKDFVMDTGTAGNYRVIVDLSKNTITLFPMAEVLASKTIIHLEKTSNVTSPLIWAYDKERTTANVPIHVDRPARNVIANERLVLYEGAPNAADVTTADGRSWWTWEVNKSISDFWFTRGSYTFNRTDLTNADMTDIQWRKSGELYLTWPSSGTALEEYTRDYYAAAAQEASESAVMIEGHLYVYFTNTPGWEHVFCHAWYTDQYGENHDLLTPPNGSTPNYPGMLCELVGYDKDGYEIWRADLTEQGVTQTPSGIVFNNGMYEGKDYYTNATTTEAQEQSGDAVYKNGTCYDYCGVIVLGRSLANIIRNGVERGPAYTIEEDLVAVYFDPAARTNIDVDGVTHTIYGALYCKDKNKFVSTAKVEKSLMKEGQYDYMATEYAQSGATVPDRYDQSNWVKVTLSTLYPGYVKDDQAGQLALLEDYAGCVIPAESIRGQIVNKDNPEIHLASALPSAGSLESDDYADHLNVYIPTSFMGSQSGTSKNGMTRDFFFVTPKPNEYALITWAVYGGDNKFYISTSGWYDYSDGNRYNINGWDLDGYFPVQWDAQSKPSDMENYSGQLMSFKAIIRLADGAGGGAGAPRRTAQEVSGEPPYTWKTNVSTSNYVISPIDINPAAGTIITSVQAADMTEREVAETTYVDVMGRTSNRPFQGVNVVITRYTDGSKEIKKIVK